MIFQEIFDSFTTPAGITNSIEKFKSFITANNSLSSKVRRINNSRIRVEFKGSCLRQDKVTFTTRNVVNLFIAYKLDTWSKYLKADITLKHGSLELSN